MKFNTNDVSMTRLTEVMLLSRQSYPFKLKLKGLISKLFSLSNKFLKVAPKLLCSWWFYTRLKDTIV